jgi:hypothetical protein
MCVGDWVSGSLFQSRRLMARLLHPLRRCQPEDFRPHDQLLYYAL